MEIGEEVYIKRFKIYGEHAHTYQRGKIYKIYKNYILVEFKYNNGNSYKESFFKHELIKKEDLKKDACIY